MWDRRAIACLATHDINYGNPQTCLDIIDILGDGSCGPYFADTRNAGRAQRCA